MKKSILQSKIEELLTENSNAKVLATGHGLNSRAHCSNIYRAIVDSGLNPTEEGKTFQVVIGGRAGRNRNDGYHFAIVGVSGQKTAKTPTAKN